MKVILRSWVLVMSILALSACGVTPESVPSTSIPDISVSPITNITASVTASVIPTAQTPDLSIPEFTFQKSTLVKAPEKKTFSVRQGFALDSLVNQSTSCGTNLSKEYFARVLKTYAPTDLATEYHFGFNGTSQESNEWVVTVMANKLNYTDLKAFEHDFGSCDAGAERYPSKVSPAYLLFASSCGSGFGDTSGLPNGCQKVQEALEPTIIFNAVADISPKAVTAVSPNSSAQTGAVYTNTNYGFSLDFAVWGSVVAEDVMVNYKAVMPVTAVLNLVSSQDKDRSLTIFIIPLASQEDPAVVDAPMTLLKKNSKYAFYYTSSADNAGAPGMEDPKWEIIYQQSKQIVKTFKLL